jgi:DNA-binding NarL/FixJ family response regulator
MEAFAAEIDEEDRRETLLRRVTRSLPPPRHLSPRREAKAAYGGLTEREREVAGLIVDGLSNPEIADRLYLSPRTATTHVSNILSKLGLRSRAQIAVWAKEHGVTGEEQAHQD